ncbi:chromosome partitioning protein ParA [Kitasatospora sp. NE20-6]|uniref:ParA family protein n=1 Tax=Kitasatospora sp. NE20-6 TaxID=2859066 RepID=UPI0034DBDDA5
MLPTQPPSTDDTPRAYAFSGQSGGAGKTQGVVNLGVELANRGHRVLIWDIDPQRSASHLLGYQDPPGGHATLFSVLTGDNKLDEAIVPARYRIAAGFSDAAFRNIANLDLVLGTPDMADAEVTLGHDPAGILWLHNVLDEQLPAGRWDAMLFDCGPTLGILLLSVVLVAPQVIGCVNDEYKYVIGLTDLESTLDRGRSKLRRLGFQAHLAHILATNIPLDQRGNVDRKAGAITDDVIRTIRNHPDWAPRLLPLIRRSIRFKETIVKQRPLRFHAPSCTALEDVAAMADTLGFERRNSTRRGR